MMVVMGRAERRRTRRRSNLFGVKAGSHVVALSNFIAKTVSMLIIKSNLRDYHHDHHLPTCSLISASISLLERIPSSLPSRLSSFDSSPSAAPSASSSLRSSS